MDGWMVVCLLCEYMYIHTTSYGHANMWPRIYTCIHAYFATVLFHEAGQGSPKCESRVVLEIRFALSEAVPIRHDRSRPKLLCRLVLLSWFRKVMILPLLIP